MLAESSSGGWPLWITVTGILVVAYVSFWVAIRRFNLPFVGRLFWKILPAVYVIAFVIFVVAIKGFGYELTNADVGGSMISGLILSYLLHLWMLPPETLTEDSTGAAPDGH